MTKSRASSPTPHRVIAVDPGVERLGIAVFEKGEKLLYSECFKTSSKLTQDKRLLALAEKVAEIIEKFAPHALAIETLFFNQNITSGIRVAEARGVVILEAARKNLDVYEYSPQSVKIAVTGYGRAGKTDIQKMVTKLVKLPEVDRKRIDDELDAIALGITHLATQKSI